MPSDKRRELSLSDCATKIRKHVAQWAEDNDHPIWPPSDHERKAGIELQMMLGGVKREVVERIWEMCCMNGWDFEGHCERERSEPRQAIKEVT